MEEIYWAGGLLVLAVLANCVFLWVNWLVPFETPEFKKSLFFGLVLPWASVVVLIGNVLNRAGKEDPWGCGKVDPMEAVNKLLKFEVAESWFFYVTLAIVLVMWVVAARLTIRRTRIQILFDCPNCANSFSVRYGDEEVTCPKCNQTYDVFKTFEASFKGPKKP